MSKRFKGKTCAYCAAVGASETGDHVFAREFFPLTKRDGLPQVPACGRCNNEKSKLEHYLTTVLPFAGRHPDSVLALRTVVPRRLAKNVKLHKELAAGRSQAWLDQGEGARRMLTLPVDADHLRGIFRFIIKGLITFHWHLHLPPTHYVGAGLLTPAGEEIVLPLLRANASQRVVGAVSDGAFRYEGVQAVDSPLLTLWCFEIYGGALFAGDPTISTAAAGTIWGMTAAQPMHELFGD